MDLNLTGQQNFVRGQTRAFLKDISSFLGASHPKRLIPSSGPVSFFPAISQSPCVYFGHVECSRKTAKHWGTRKNKIDTASAVKIWRGIHRSKQLTTGSVLSLL